MAEAATHPLPQVVLTRATRLAATRRQFAAKTLPEVDSLGIMSAMRVAILILALAPAAVLSACNGLRLGAASAASLKAIHQPASSPSASPRIDFATQIRPILEARCQPCHFSGGKVYAHLPFDRPETIKSLGTKLFTRIKDEKEQKLIREFLAQQ